MQTALIVGLSVTRHDVAAAAAHNSSRLAEHGWTVVPEGHPPVPPEADGAAVRRLAEETMLQWQSWLESSDSEAALFVCLHLANALLMSGQADRMVGAARSRGDCRCGALVLRPDEHTAASYLKDLVAGRFRPLSERELAFRGVSNYLARLAKWRDAAGPAFVAVVSPPQSEERALRRLLDGLGVPDADSLTLPAPVPSQPLDSAAAEVLRRFNRVLVENELDTPTAGELRGKAVSTLLADPPSEPFSIPSAAARAQLDVFRDDILRLSEAMSPEDRDYFVRRDVPEDPSVDEDHVRSRLEELASQFGVAIDAKRPLTSEEQALADAKRFARRAQSARDSGDTRRYRNVVERFRGTLPQMPQFSSAGVGSHGVSQIPARVVQYWDPAPAPDEMVPWLESWESVALPGGEHIVADYDSGLRAVAQVAGDLGRQAYEAASHPAARADLYRYAELYLHGGWYADAEHEAVMPLGDVFTWDVEHVFVIRTRRPVIVNNFLGAKPGSDLLKNVLLTGCRNVLEKEGGSIVQRTGPLMLTALVNEYVNAPEASYVMLPTNVVFGGVMQVVHNSAEYKVHGHWRYSDLPTEDT